MPEIVSDQDYGNFLSMRRRLIFEFDIDLDTASEISRTLMRADSLKNPDALGPDDFIELARSILPAHVFAVIGPEFEARRHEWVPPGRER